MPDPLQNPDPAPRDLHPREGLRPGAWYACDYPERPPIPEVTAFDPRCGSCNLALEAVRRLSGQNLTMDQRSLGGIELPVKVKTDSRLREARDRRR